MNVLKTAWHDILLCWTFFTRIPAPHFMTERKLSQALWALPLVGLMIWLPTWGLANLLWVVENFWQIFLKEENAALHVTRLNWMPIGTNLVWVIIPIALTGALHWDGIADFFDGLGVPKERRAGVMRDSSIGAFGVIALISIFMIQMQFYAALWSNAFAILAIIIAARSCMGLAWAITSPLDAKSQTTKYGRPNWTPQVIALLLCALFLLISGVLTLFGLLACILLVAASTLFVTRSLGGSSGDGLGAIQVLSETILLIAVVIF